MNAKKAKQQEVAVEPQESKQPKDAKAYKEAIHKGKTVLTQGGSKADAAREINALLANEEREIVLRAFIEGASITEKGAPTYFYNIQRKARRKNGKKEASQPSE